jgi:hypothetical protein
LLSTHSKIEDYYILIYSPDHPRATYGYVPEHILEMEKSLGRNLTDDEDVRHINGDVKDNRIANLSIFSNTTFYPIDFVQGTTGRRFMPCRFQKICWDTVRSPKAKKKKVTIPFICSYQELSDVYECPIFWDFKQKELEKER